MRAACTIAMIAAAAALGACQKHASAPDDLHDASRDMGRAAHEVGQSPPVREAAQDLRQVGAEAHRDLTTVTQQLRAAGGEAAQQTRRAGQDLRGHAAPARRRD